MPGIPIMENVWGKVKKQPKVFLKENPQISQEIDSIIRDTLAAEPLNVLGHDDEADAGTDTVAADIE